MVEFKSNRPRHCPLPTNRKGEVPQMLSQVSPGETVEILPSRGGRFAVVVVEHAETAQKGNGRTIVEIGEERQVLSSRTSCV